jgi:preprotein translocase subunit YajC
MKAFTIALSVLFSSSVLAQGIEPPGGAGVFNLVLLGGMFVLFYFIAIRPQRKRSKETQDMLGALAVGDEVATTSGLLGKVRKIEDSFIVLKVSENVDLKFQKVAIHAVLPKGTIKSIG